LPSTVQPPNRPAVREPAAAHGGRGALAVGPQDTDVRRW
jgi:hypothetical protein